jgi:hypothetical protein
MTEQAERALLATLHLPMTPRRVATVYTGEAEVKKGPQLW